MRTVALMLGIIVGLAYAPALTAIIAITLLIATRKAWR